jgi:hypothetical protein
MHRHLKRVCRSLGRILTPQRVDQAVPSNDRVGVEEEKREQSALPPAPDGKDTTVLLDFEQAEQPELDPLTPISSQSVP